MAIQDRATLYAQFQNNDVPTEVGFQNLIDSAANLATTSAQDFQGPISTTELVTSRVSAGAANFNGIMSATTITMVQLNTQAIKILPFVVSAAGTTQGTATVLGENFTIGRGVTDSSATGWAISQRPAGNMAQFVNDTTLSANLYPPSGGTINGLGTNAAFALAAKTSYTIDCVTSLSYFVK